MPAVRCWPWGVFSSWLASRDLGTARSSYLEWVRPVVLSEWGPEIYISKAIDCISVSETEIDTAIFWINILDWQFLWKIESLIKDIWYTTRSHIFQIESVFITGNNCTVALFDWKFYYVRTYFLIWKPLRYLSKTVLKPVYWLKSHCKPWIFLFICLLVSFSNLRTLLD